MSNEFTEDQKQWIEKEVQLQLEKMWKEWLKQWVKDEVAAQAKR